MSLPAFRLRQIRRVKLRRLRGAAWGLGCGIFALLTLLILPGCNSGKEGGSRSVALLEALDELPQPPTVAVNQWQQMKAELRRWLSAEEVDLSPGPPLHPRSKVDDLILAEQPDGRLALRWSYKNSGDYDQNSEVNIADLTPIGAAWFARETHGDWPKARLADGDGNGEVNIADVTPIGAGFKRSIDRYVVEYSAAESGPFAAVSEVPQSSGEPPSGQHILRYDAYVDSPAEGWYRVVPQFAGVSGIASDPAFFDQDDPPPPLNDPPIPWLALDKGLGIPPLEVTFDASQSYDPDGAVVNYEWDMDGDGVYEANTGGEPTYTHTFVDPGHTRGRVRVTDDDGAQATAAQVVSAVNFHYSEVKSGGRLKIAPSAPVLLNGKPAVVFTWRRNDLEYLTLGIAKTELPAGPADWDIIDLSPSEHAAWGGVATLIEGRLAIVYRSELQGRRMRLALASTPEPRAATDFVFSDINTGGPSRELSAMNIGGRLAVAYDGEDGRPLQYLRADVPYPSAPSDWSISEIIAHPGSGSARFLLGQREGKPLLAAYFEADGALPLWLGMASVPEPAQPSDWTTGVIQPLSAGAWPPSPVWSGNHLSVNTAEPDVDDSENVMSTAVAQPFSPADWQEFSAQSDWGFNLTTLGDRSFWVTVKSLEVTLWAGLTNTAFAPAWQPVQLTLPEAFSDGPALWLAQREGRLMLVLNGTPDDSLWLAWSDPPYDLPAE